MVKMIAAVALLTMTGLANADGKWIDVTTDDNGGSWGIAKTAESPWINKHGVVGFRAIRVQNDGKQGHPKGEVFVWEVVADCDGQATKAVLLRARASTAAPVKETGAKLDSLTTLEWTPITPSSAWSTITDSVCELMKHKPAVQPRPAANPNGVNT